jgi:hypothetical protein
LLNVAYLVCDANLDGSIVDKKAIQLLESLASTIRLVESDIGNAAADRVGAINEIYSLDRSNGLDKVFLTRKSVSLSIVDNPVLIFEIRVQSYPTQS